MQRKAHAATGLAAAAATIPLAVVLGAPIPGWIVAGAAAAEYTDSDHPGATFATTWGPVTGAMSWVVRLLLGGHRAKNGTHHPVIGTIAFTVVTWAALQWRPTEVVAIALPIGLAGRMIPASVAAVLRHRPPVAGWWGPIRYAVADVVLFAVTLWWNPLLNMAVSLGLGWLIAATGPAPLWLPAAVGVGYLIGGIGPDRVGFENGCRRYDGCSRCHRERAWTWTMYAVAVVAAVAWICPPALGTWWSSLNSTIRY